MKCAFYTLATDDFVPGVYCLAKSLKRVTKIPLYCLGLNLNKQSKKHLESVGCQVIDTSYLGITLITNCICGIKILIK
jgi:hypothetical protein